MQHKTAWRSGHSGECPLCVEGAKGRSHHKGHFGPSGGFLKEVQTMARFLQKKNKGAVLGASDNGVSLPTFPIELVALSEFLCDSEWDDGSPREPGSLVLFVEAGRLKACLSDKDQHLVGFVSAATWLGLLAAVEQGLEEGTIDWRASRETKRRT